jgi:glutamate--cysteine ligase
MYNSLEEYVAGLKEAIHTSSDIYSHIDDYTSAEPKQLNKNILQIENEFYSPIRPKRNAASGETPTDALLRGGIEYIEVRALDVNPFSETGIDLQQIRFLDVFLTYCLLNDSPEMDWQEQKLSTTNLDAVVNEGRNPELTLNKQGNKVRLTDWAAAIFNDLTAVARYMDSAYGVSYYSETIAELATWVNSPSKTFSGRYVGALASKNQDNGHFALALAEQYKQNHLDAEYQFYDHAFLTKQASDSVLKEREVKAADSVSFTAFLDDYFAKA